MPIQIPILPHLGSILELATVSGQAIELSLHSPSPFITQNLERVLPDWNLPVAWVVLVLQQSRFALETTASHIEREKDRLREKFLRFASEVAFELRDFGFLSDLIDPRTGYPWLSRSGEISHDDTAVVKALRGFSVTTDSCSVLSHPTWGNSVYPGTLITSAAPSVTEPVLLKLAVQQGWKLVTTQPLEIKDEKALVSIR